MPRLPIDDGRCPGRQRDQDALCLLRRVVDRQRQQAGFVLGVEMDVPEHDPFMEEHLKVFDAMLARKRGGAADALKRHLRSSCPKVIDRLETFKRIFTPPPVDYIS